MRHLFEGLESKKTIEPRRTGFALDQIRVIIDSGYSDDLNRGDANIVMNDEEAYLFATTILSQVEEIQREKISKLSWWRRILS